MAEIPKKPEDHITQLLRAAAHRKRPWTLGTALLAFVVFGVPLGLLVWLFWPWPHPPELIVLGFDEVVSPGKAVTLRAATKPLEGDERWGGQVLYLEEMTLDWSERDRPVEVRTDKNGIAEKEWRVKTPGPIAEIEARYIDKRMNPEWFDRARLRVFTWPRDARLIVMDVEPTLKNATDWPELAKALSAAQGAGWRIAYLAVEADTPAGYTVSREWVLAQVLANKDRLVDGPVLGRLTLFDGAASSAARRAVLAGLKTEFSGPVLYLTGEAELTLQGVANNGALAGEPQRLKGWSNLVGALPK